MNFALLESMGSEVAADEQEIRLLDDENRLLGVEIGGKCITEFTK